MNGTEPRYNTLLHRGSNIMFRGIQGERINGAVMRNDRIDRNFNCGIRDKSITTGAEFAFFDGEMM